MKRILLNLLLSSLVGAIVERLLPRPPAPGTKPEPPRRHTLRQQQGDSE